MNDIHELFWNYVPAQGIRTEVNLQDLESLRFKLYGAACSLLAYDCIHDALEIAPQDLVDAFLRRNA